MPIGDLTLISIHTHTYAWRITATKKARQCSTSPSRDERELRELRELRRKPHG